jgi:hypothetical protein
VHEREAGPKATTESVRGKAGTESNAMLFAWQRQKSGK